MATENVEIEFKGNSSDAQKAINSLNNRLEELEKKLGLAGKKSDEFGKKGSKAMSGFGSSVKSLLPVLGVAGLVGGLSLMINKSLEAADVIDKTSKSVGLSAEAYQELQFATEQTGISQSLLNISLKAIQNRSALAANGINEYSKSYAKLGINVERFNKLELADKFSVLAEQISKVEDPGQKVQIAVALLGDSGRELIPLLDKGAAGLDAYRKRAQELGTVLGSETIKKQVELKDKLHETKKQFDVVTSGLTEDLIPAMNFLLTSTAEVVKGLKLFDGVLEDIYNKIFTAKGLDIGFVNDIDTVKSKIAELKDDIDTFGSDSDIGQKASEELMFYNNNLKVLQAQAKGSKTSLDGMNKVIEKAKIETKEVAKNTALLTEEDKKNIEAIKQQTDAQKEVAKIMSEFQGVLDRSLTPLEKYTASVERFNKIKDKFSPVDQAKILGELGKMKDGFTKTTNSMKSIAEETAKSLQSNFEEGFFNAMNGNFDGLLDSFVQTIDRMVAKAAAAQLAESLGINGEGGGFLGDILGSGSGGGGFDIGGLFSGVGDFFGGFFANGGDVNAGQPIVVGENGPEMIIPRSNGTVIPNGGSKNINITMNISTPDADSFRKNQRQIMAEAAQSINVANARDS